LHYHIVFSTKSREHWIRHEFEERIWAYLAGIAKINRMHPIQIGGIEDHVHCLLSAPAVFAPAKIAQLIKGSSSGRIQATFPQLRGFCWQDGYGAFTVSKSNVPEVAK
jgi:REP element-mobilizing transposase RayT